MSELDNREKEEHTQNYRRLIQNQKTLLLATVSNQSEPECSYAPYIKDQDNVFYIFVSELATHTKNMLQTSKSSVMFIKPEQETKNFFVRERVIFDCQVNEIQQQDEQYVEQLDKMTEQFGETVELLRSLPDFHLLALTPVKGKYVAGFGKAFVINVEDGELNF